MEKNDIQTAVIPEYIMEYPNERIVFYEGEFMIKGSSHGDIKLIGEIYFNWSPLFGPRFKGEIIEGVLPVNSLTNLEFIINNQTIGLCYINRGKHFSSIDAEDKALILGGFNNKRLVLGDNKFKAKTIKFSILNLDSFFGDIIQNGNGSRQFSRARLELNHPTFTVNIDKDFNYTAKREALEDEGGYQILYYGEITANNEPLVYNDVCEIIKIIGEFLTFVSGKRVTPIFISAMEENCVIYRDISGYDNNPFEFRQSWANKDHTGYLSGLFQNFYKLWKSGIMNENFLITIIHWYEEINCNKTYLEKGLILAQTGLELLYNWLVVEKVKLIKGEDQKRINAANKIRLLVSHLSLSYDIPKKFESLEKFKNDHTLSDGIEAIVQIRNAIVHSQEAKRNKLQKIKKDTIKEAIHLSLWYIELALLKILEYDDKYTNRCSEELYATNKLETLPWK